MKTRSQTLRARGVPVRRGVTLVEVLVALVVMAFGMLALAGFQITMSRSADVAKQRSEAVRIAQREMERLRSIETVVSDVGRFDYVNDVLTGSRTVDGAQSGADNVTTNTSFAVNWTVSRSDGTAATSTNAGNDPEKWIKVAVVWTDRTGASQSVTLRSVIGRNDPIDLGTLATGPGGTKNRTPKNRNINIPYPAITLSGGTSSAFMPPPGNVIYVFDNTNGNVVQSCTPQPFSVVSVSGTGTVVTINTSTNHPFSAGNTVRISGVTPANTSPAFNGTFTVANVLSATSFTYAVSTPFSSTTTGSGGTATKVVALVEGIDLNSVTGLTCSTKNGYLLSGYVRFLSSNPSGNEAAQDAIVSQASETPLDLTAQIVDYVNPSGGAVPNAPVCYAQRQKVVRYSNPPSTTITSGSVSGGVATMTNSGNNGFSVGQTVVVSGTTNSVFDGQRVITARTNGSFSFAFTGSGSTSAGSASLLQDIVLDYSATNPSGYSVVDQYVAYSCVVEYYDSGTITKSWWGRFMINPVGGWSLATSGSSNYKVCRFSGDYVGDNIVSNSEHPLYYRAVNYTLDNQNYLVITADMNCPTDSEVDIPNKDYVNSNTILHQTTTSTSGGSGGSFSSGSQWSPGQEDSGSTTSTIPML